MALETERHDAVSRTSRPVELNAAKKLHESLTIEEPQTGSTLVVRILIHEAQSLLSSSESR